MTKSVKRNDVTVQFESRGPSAAPTILVMDDRGFLAVRIRGNWTCDPFLPQHTAEVDAAIARFMAGERGDPSAESERAAWIEAHPVVPHPHAVEDE